PHRRNGFRRCLSDIERGTIYLPEACRMRFRRTPPYMFRQRVMDTEITGPQPPSPSGSGEAEPEPDRPRLRLHIPQHHPAPGERPDFTALPRFDAGAVRRPDIPAPAPETHPLAYQLIRVLDDEGDAVGAWN